MKFLNVCFLISFSILASCNSVEEKCGNSSQDLETLIKSYEERDSYDREEYPLGLFTREHYKEEAKYAEDQLHYFGCINMEELSETEQISAKLLKFVLEDQIDYYKFERFLNPLLSDSGFHSSLNYQIRPISNDFDAEEYLKKLNSLPQFVDQHFVNLREGLAKGVSQPKVIFKGYESTYNDHIVADYKESPFYQPFKKLPSIFSEKYKDSILTAAKETIEEKVIPQFKRIKTFFETEYLPKTRTTLGVSETPNGVAYYQNRINFYTTSSQYTADDIHQIGLKEVTRIRSEMKKIIADLNFRGSFPNFLKFIALVKLFEHLENQLER